MFHIHKLTLRFGSQSGPHLLWQWRTTQILKNPTRCFIFLGPHLQCGCCATPSALPASSSEGEPWNPLPSVWLPILPWPSDLWAWFTILSLRGPQLPPAPPARLLPAAVRPELASVHRRSAHTPERLCSRWRGALSELQSCLWNPDPLPSKPGLSLEQGTLLYIQARSRPLQLPSWCSSAEMWPTDCSCSGGLRKSPNSDLIVQSLNIKGRLCIVQTSVKAFPINFEDNNSVLLEKT